jgi:CRP-like cAMP-binding protein
LPLKNGIDLNDMERYDFLKTFYALPPADYQMLAQALKSKHFKRGEHLIIPGQTQRELFFVKSGIQMCCHETDCKTNVIAFTYAPNLCAIPASFATQQPSKYFFTCLTDSEMEYITYEDLQKLFNQSQPIERLFRKITETLLANLLDRHIEFRTTTIEQRFKAFCQRSPHLLQLVPHKYISSYLGIDPTNFSKLFNTVKF